MPVVIDELPPTDIFFHYSIVASRDPSKLARRHIRYFISKRKKKRYFTQRRTKTHNELSYQCIRTFEL